MAVDMFLKFEGKDIKGESKDEKHPDEIDILAWSWGITNSSSWGMGGGGGAGKASVQDLSFTHYIDASSAALMLMCGKGEHIPKGTLVVRKAGGEALEYYKMTMDKIFVTSISTGGSGGEDRLTENVTLNFAKIKIEYKKQKDDGTGVAAGDFSIDVTTNAVA